VLIVGTHTGLLSLASGAHLLLSVAGCNFAGSTSPRRPAPTGAVPVGQHRPHRGPQHGLDHRDLHRDSGWVDGAPGAAWRLR
jgi:hypothetical protein